MSPALDGVEGWLTGAQADRLAAAAGRLGPGARLVEIGSFRGRSTIVLAGAAPADAEVVAIDPHLGSDRGPQEFAEQHALGSADLEAFRTNLSRAGVLERVRHVRERSQDALGAVTEPVDLLYVDGAHRYGPARDDLVRWGARVSDGGTLLVHDSFSSIGVTLALLRGVVFGAEWRYRGRVGSLAEYARTPVRGRARLANAARQLAELPWFARNVVIKALILARLRRGPWPY
jgi:predicted O-methyltransferase YrrM